ncbi:MAG: hypothetical protein KGZ58_04550 [Ignavibacteriales bacterium]|nr:hypothetical protein [Ignavibacteriales bacterium]
MKNFELPDDLSYNKGPINEPAAYLKESGCTSWLYLIGEEFSRMENGMSYEQVQSATPHCINVISDPPQILSLDLARQHVEALDSLPRPTLISCRTGPRASAVAYMYSGLKLGVEPDEVLAAAEKDNAPFTQFEEYKDWVRSSIESLREK